jgi:hypothetical protein
VPAPAGSLRFSGMSIVPDTQDWTWVIHRRCPECGFDASSVRGPEVPALIRENALAWRDLLARADPRVATRPSPDRWSTLEYGCHVRDVYRIFHRRLKLMLTQDDPTFENWDQDSTAVQDRYGEQDPAVVADELHAAALALADAFQAVDGQQWQRTGNRTDGARFTVDTFARYLAHDPIHHLYDVGGKSRK